jgi:hypothetical protein
MRIEQKKWPYYRKYEIKPDHLEIDFKTDNGTFIQIAWFEEIEFEVLIENKKPSPIKTGLAVSIMFNVILLILYLGDRFIDLNSPMNFQAMIAIPIVFIIFGKTYFRVEQLKFLLGGQKILSFWYDDKNKKDVDSFILKLKEAKRNYIREKYLKIEELEESSAVRAKLSWLKTAEHIDENELKDWLERLEKRTIIKGF